MKFSCIAFILSFVLIFSACKNSTEKTDTHEGHAHEGHDHGAHDHHHEEGEAEHEEEEAELTETQYKSVGIQLGSIEKRAMAGTIQATGTLAMPPQYQITISFPYGGIVRQTSLQPGRWINQGDVLLTLENPEFISLQQEYLEAYSQLSYSEKENQRQEELSRENVAAAKSFQRTSADLKSLQARLEGLKQKLRLLNMNPGSLEKGISRVAVVRAPSSGYLTHVNVNTGKAVQANEMLAELSDTRFLQAEVSVFEKDIARLKTGQTVRLQLGNESQSRNATIILIGREISPERMVKVICKLQSPSRELLPGTYFTAHIEAGTSSVETLPEAAVVRSGDKQYIFVSEGTHKEEGGVHYPFKRVEIRTGLAQNGYVEVFPPAGIESGKIVLKGAYDLLSVMNNSEHGHSH